MTASSTAASRSKSRGIGGMRLTGDLIVRAAALAAVLVVAVAVAVTLLGGPGGGYTGKADFPNAPPPGQGKPLPTRGAPLGQGTENHLTPHRPAPGPMKNQERHP